jgi:hypothetical protein
LYQSYDAKHNADKGEKGSRTDIGSVCIKGMNQKALELK